MLLKNAIGELAGVEKVYPFSSSYKLARLNSCNGNGHPWGIEMCGVEPFGAGHC